MHRPRPKILVAMTVVAVALVACGGGAGASPSAATSGASPSGALEGDPVLLTLTAKDIAYVPATLSVPSGRPIHLRFDNQDAGVPHNVVLQAGPTLSTELIKTEIITGVASQDTLIPGLVPGRYQFMCAVHPNMTAELQVPG